MTPERIKEIMQMNNAQMLPELEAIGLRYREQGLYEKAKLTDDVIDMLETSKPNEEYTDSEKQEKAEAVRDIWRRMMEIMRP